MRQETKGSSDSGVGDRWIAAPVHDMHCLPLPKDVLFSKNPSQPSPEDYMDVVIIQTACGVISLCNNRLHWLQYPNFASLVASPCASERPWSLFSVSQSNLHQCPCLMSLRHSQVWTAACLPQFSCLRASPRAFHTFNSYTVDTARGRCLPPQLLQLNTMLWATANLLNAAVLVFCLVLSVYMKPQLLNKPMKQQEKTSHVVLCSVIRVSQEICWAPKSDFNKRDPSSLHVDLVLQGTHLTPKWLNWLWVQVTAIKVYLGFP